MVRTKFSGRMYVAKASWICMRIGGQQVLGVDVRFIERQAARGIAQQTLTDL